MVGASKLNEKQVEEIKNHLKEGKLLHKEIAELYKVSRTHITLIKNGKRWNPQERSFVSKKEIQGFVPEFNEYLNKKSFTFWDWVLAGWKKVVSLYS